MGVIFLMLKAAVVLVHVHHICSGLNPCGMKWEGHKKDRGVEILVVCRIERGFGDINWAINIGKEVERSLNVKPSFLFYNGKRNSVEHLERRSEFMVEYIDDIEKIEERCLEGGGRAYIYSPVKEEDGVENGCEIGRSEVVRLQEMYDLVIGFNCLSFLCIRESEVNRNVIFIDEYGKGVNMSRIFFKDYRRTYGDMIDGSFGYDRIKVSPSEFYSRLKDQEKKRYRVEYIKQVVPSEKYYFTYFAQTVDDEDLCSRMRFIKCACIELNRLTSEGGMTILTNTDIKEWGRREYMERRGKRYSVGSRLTVCEERDMMCELKERFWIREGSQDFTLDLYIPEHSLDIKLVYYGKLSAEEFEYIMLRSERIAGCTGDMSLTQVISSRRIFIYEFLKHKERFIKDLMEVWRSVTGNSRLMCIDTGLQKVSSFEYYSGFREDYERFVLRLQEDSFQKWFLGRLQEVMRMCL